VQVADDVQLVEGGPPPLPDEPPVVDDPPAPRVPAELAPPLVKIAVPPEPPLADVDPFPPVAEPSGAPPTGS
jgi:hypothetical protein